MSSPYPPPGQPNPFGQNFDQNYGQQPQFPSPGGYYSGNFQGDPQFGIRPPPASPLAICSMIGGIVSLLFSWIVCCCYLSPLIFGAGLTSVIMGHIALSQIHRSQGTISGKELAWVGLGTGYAAVAISGVVMGIMIFTFVAAATAPPPAATPTIAPSAAEMALSDAEAAILDGDQGTAQGNTPAAVALATKFSLRMKKLRDDFAIANQGIGVTASDGEFITWCELHEGSCAFIVHVPNYRNYSSFAEDKIEKLAWTAAQEIVKGELAEGDDLAVATKGLVLWGNIMVGNVTAAPNAKNGLLEEGEEDELLYPFFEPRESDDSADSSRIKLPDEPAEANDD